MAEHLVYTEEAQVRFLYGPLKKMFKAKKFVYWTPRILGILFILFLTLFSFDVFEGNYGFWGTILALFMHNIPSIILLVLLIISWKKELVGAITFITAGIIYIVLLIISGLKSNQFEWYMISWSLIVAGPAFLVGILFFIGWRQKKKNKKKR